MTISDAEMVEGMRIVAERMKLVVEASSGAAIAATVVARDQLDRKFPGLKRVGVILCGGNLDLDHIPWLKETP